jgi:hypothetical protein
MSSALVSPFVKGEDMLAAYWDAVTLLDADQVASQFAEGGAFCFGDNAPVRGRRSIRRALVQLFTNLAGISHAPVALWSQQGLVIDEADVSLTFEDGGRTVIPMTTLLWTSENQIHACRVQHPSEPALLRRTCNLGRCAKA